jgi:hypothetical protein
MTRRARETLPSKCKVNRGELHFPVASLSKGDDPNRGKMRVDLDLGNVAIVAQLKVNGKEIGTLWKAPYAVEITSALKPGENSIEIKVTCGLTG